VGDGVSDFAYIIPADLTIRRLFQSEAMSEDRFAVLLAGDVLAELDWAEARALWLGKLTPVEALAGKRANDLI
jgi:hypothetical protein